MILTIFIVVLYLSFYYCEDLNIGLPTCKKEFFTIIADKMPWNNQSESCEISFNKINDRIISLSSAMTLMNSSLTIYSSFSNLYYCKLSHFINLSNVKIEYFDGNKLLDEFGYTNNIRKNINKWTLTGYARSSDIIRLLLAHKYQQIYVDTDIFFIDYNITNYIYPFVSIAIWQDIENSIEISNSAFCFNRNILNNLISYQKNRIEFGNINYQYTELGPSMFHKVLINQLFGISLYSQNHPKERNFMRIAQSILLYNHKFLHLTTAIRKGHQQLLHEQMGNKIVKLYHNLLHNITNYQKYNIVL